MSQVAMAKSNSSRAIALARRKAMSSGGKAALKLAANSAGSSGGGNASATSATQPAAASAISAAPGVSAREASLARRKAMSVQGKAAVKSKDRVRADTIQKPASFGATANDPQTGERQGCGCGCGGTKVEECVNRNKKSVMPAGTNSKPSVVARSQVAANPAKSAALARRKALSTLGKAGMNGSAKTATQMTGASNPGMSSREVAKALREERSKNGKAAQNKSEPSRRQGNSSETSAKGSNAGAAQDASWKVGASVTVSGQTVTGTMVGRQGNMTGDEPSTCRTITGTEYLGADIFNKFCKSNANATNARKVEVTSTSRGNQVSGNRMGRGSNVTGNEHATCKRITGNEYSSAEQQIEFCGTSPTKSPSKGSMAQTMKDKTVTGNNVGRSENVTGNEYGQRRRLTGTQYTKSENLGFAPAKVGFSTTIRGGGITGTMVGRGERVTGNKHSTCRNITGDDYIGREQFGTYCKSTPDATDSKIAVSQTLAGLKVTGDLAQRSQIVTGDEPGTCKAMTGTPYSGRNQYQEYCDEAQAQAAQARMQPSGRTYGKPMTGQQPGIGGKLTGANKGACEPVSGTPYVGSDQAAAACPGIPAEAGSTNYPGAPWGNFSVNAPIHAAQHDGSFSHMTGSRYESGHITGSFGKAAGKVTGTEEAHFDNSQRTQSTAQPAMPGFEDNVSGRVKSRITGEGMESGLKITGDDWDRGDQVTGTEGASATQRNMTLRGGPMSAMQKRADMVRPKNIPEPVSKVTGGSGNTDKGSLITYSGGARG